MILNEKIKLRMIDLIWFDSIFFFYLLGSLGSLCIWLFLGVIGVSGRVLLGLLGISGNLFNSPSVFERASAKIY